MTGTPAQPLRRAGRKFGTALQPSLLTLESPVPQVCRLVCRAKKLSSSFEDKKPVLWVRIRPDPNLFGRIRILSNRPDSTKNVQKRKINQKNKIVFCVEKLTFLKYNRTFLNKKQKIVHKTSVVDPDQYWIRIRNMDPDPHMQI